MSIELSILPHQEDFIKAVRKTFDNISVVDGKNIHENPIINLSDDKIRKNINDLWNGFEDLDKIPMSWRTHDDDNYLGIDIRMETGERVIIVMGAVCVIKSRVSGTLNKYISCIA